MSGDEVEILKVSGQRRVLTLHSPDLTAQAGGLLDCMTPSQRASWDAQLRQMETNLAQRRVAAMPLDQLTVRHLQRMEAALLGQPVLGSTVLPQDEPAPATAPQAPAAPPPPCGAATAGPSPRRLLPAWAWALAFTAMAVALGHALAGVFSGQRAAPATAPTAAPKGPAGTPPAPGQPLRRGGAQVAAAGGQP